MREMSMTKLWFSNDCLYSQTGKPLRFIRVGKVQNKVMVLAVEWDGRCWQPAEPFCRKRSLLRKIHPEIPLWMANPGKLWPAKDTVFTQDPGIINLIRLSALDYLDKSFAYAISSTSPDRKKQENSPFEWIFAVDLGLACTDAGRRKKAALGSLKAACSMWLAAMQTRNSPTL